MPPPTPATNDGSDAPPRLALFLNLGTLDALPASSAAPRGEPTAVLAALKAAGFEGVQGGGEFTRPAHDLGMRTAGGGRVDAAGDAGELARRARDAGHACSTLHVGTGLEDDAAIDRLIAAVVEASAEHGYPLYVETHRATVTQDPWRTVRLLERHPGLRLNGDFSHWYTGCEMRYGDVDAKLDFMAPAFDRVRFLHGRIGNGGSMQVDAGDGSGRDLGDVDPASTTDQQRAARSMQHVRHFREIWTRAFAGFLRNAGPGDYVAFAPEILRPAICYARVFPGPDGEPVEETDRWAQALVYATVARECFAAAGRAG